MLSWEIEKNVISALYYKGNNIINPWGFETADSSAFFSLEKGVGYRYKTETENYNFNETEYNAFLDIKMKEGHWNLNISDKIEDNSITRHVEALTLDDSIFMDFVMRFRFKKEFIKHVNINDTEYTHNNTNVYYQYPVSNVFLQGEGFKINISILDSIIPTGFEPVMYIRDQIDEWIVHVRMIPKKWDKEVIKLCSSWAATRPLPLFLSNIILKSTWLRTQLWYRGEKKPYQFKLMKFINPCAFAMVNVKKNTQLMWKVKLEIT